jgi:hypothetical protein
VRVRLEVRRAPWRRRTQRSDGLWKGRRGGIGYAARDMARQVKWEDPALRREREREKEKERTRASGRRACEKARARTRGEKTREREREKRERERGHAYEKERERERECTRERGRGREREGPKTRVGWPGEPQLRGVLMVRFRKSSNARRIAGMSQCVGYGVILRRTHRKMPPVRRGVTLRRKRVTRRWPRSGGE